MPARPTFCRSSCTGSVKASSTKATAHNLSDCIECGACAWVCPSSIPLVQYFRQEKAEINEIRLEDQRAAEAKARFEASTASEREKIAREERHKRRRYSRPLKIKMPFMPLWHGCEKQQQATQPIVIQSGSLPDNSAVAAAREARKAQARAAQAEKQQTADEATDPRKAAVEVAIARAKARKAAQQPEAEATPAASDETIDPRKAAVEAAIARAKARKARSSRKRKQRLPFR
jgi:electron transport complex protein RnfC